MKNDFLLIGEHNEGRYIGGYSDQGVVYKDEEAYKTDRNAICYIAEAGFETYKENHKDWSITEDEAREEIRLGGASTHNSLFAELKDYLIGEFGENRIEDEFVEKCCDYVFYTCDWQCCSSLWYEADFEEDLIWYIVDKAKAREDWNTEWDDECLYNFIKENLYDEHKPIDDIIDEFTELPNY